MTVLEQAIAIPGDWEHDLLHHLDHGWVYASPTAFGLARVVTDQWPDETLRDVEEWLEPADVQDEDGGLTDSDLMWYFTRVAGNVAEVLSRLPFPLALAGWHRHRGERTITHRYDFDRFCRHFRAYPQPPAVHREAGFHAIERGRRRPL